MQEKIPPKQEFYEGGTEANFNIPYIQDDSGHHFFLRANVIIIISVFVLVVVLLIGGFLAIKSKQNHKKDKAEAVKVSPTPSPTELCRPRPACLDAEPRCLIAEIADMCPPPSGSPDVGLEPTPEGIFCTMEAKQCPDGSYVGRQAPNCDFSPCLTSD